MSLQKAYIGDFLLILYLAFKFVFKKIELFFASKDLDLKELLYE